MIDYKPFADGVTGVLHVKWGLALTSPLFIRGTTVAAFKNTSATSSKGRGDSLEINWDVDGEAYASKNKSYSQITDFNYVFEVNNGSVSVKYDIPASSVRGTLRSAAISRLIQLDDRHAFTISKFEEKTPEVKKFLTDQVSKAKERLQSKKDFWFDILSLFGLTLEIDENDTDPMTWAGRLKISTDISVNAGGNRLTYAGAEVPNSAGPGNITTNISVRNPLDRVSMGAKDGGLHNWLEMSEQQHVMIDMQILNPRKNDFKLLSLWKDDIDAGFIKFGGMTSQGRGKAKVMMENYNLYVSPKSPHHSFLTGLNKHDKALNSDLSGIWDGASVTLSELLGYANMA